MNIISYSLFGARKVTPDNSFEFFSYMRGFLFNVLMNKLVYPQWVTHVELDSGTYSDYDNFFNWLKEHYGITYDINQRDPLCKAMLWRLKPIFNPDVQYVICRDADAITTYREAQATQSFINSGMFVHGITDNIAHGVPLMGGMISFKANIIREKYGSWDNLLAESKIGFAQHGTDQIFLNSLIYPEYKTKMFAHYLSGMKDNGEGIVKTEIEDIPLEGVSPALWESSLCARHIGSAGVVEMETIRFFKRFGAFDKINEIAHKYPKIFYWVP